MNHQRRRTALRSTLPLAVAVAAAVVVLALTGALDLWTVLAFLVALSACAWLASRRLRAARRDPRSGR